MRYFIVLATFIFAVKGADTKFQEMDYGDVLTMSVEAAQPVGENIIRKGLVQRLETQALPIKGTPIGKGRVIKSTEAIEKTELDAVYQIQRERSNGYLIAVPEGEYKVTLMFAETKRKEAGERVFDILVQQKLIKENFDPFKEAGGQNIAIDIVLEKVAVKQFLRLELIQKSTRSTPAIAGIIIENEKFTKKINCGGKKVGDFEEDWDSDDFMENPFSTGVLFDTELIRYAAVWSNGFIKLKGTAYDATHGTFPEIQGDQAWGTGFLPGWVPEGKNFTDPRPDHLGNLSRDWAHYKGLYRHSSGNVLKYTVGGSEVLDKMKLLKILGEIPGQAYVRTIQADSLSKNSDVLIFEAEGEKSGNIANGEFLNFGSGIYVSCKGLAKPEYKFISRVVDNKTFTAVYLKVPAGKNHFAVGVYKNLKSVDGKDFADQFSKINLENLKEFTSGSKLRWEGVVETEAVQGKNSGTFVIDEMLLPENNPWRSWMRPGAFDFTKDGKSLYLSTWSGDVWRADGLDNKNKISWKRFAAGLFHPLGLKVVNEKVYVQCRDQIAILHDFNNDGEADFYENFNNDIIITENFHEFSFELQRDEKGNFYFIKGAPVIPGGEGFGKLTAHHGKLFKISADGEKFEVIASGFRAPNGMSISPDGQLTSSDNEGTWVAATPINWLKEGGFYGVKPTASGKTAPEKRSSIICWIPHKIDNSGGGQVWIPKGEWGEFGGELLHISYGQAKIFHVLKEFVDGDVQGGVVDLQPVGNFEAGIMRGRFNAADKSVYLAGLKGWQTKGIKDGGLYRVRYTEKKECRPIGLSVGKNGVKITFNEPLTENSALDAGNYDVSRWVYAIHDQYGSKHYKVPDRQWDLKTEWLPIPASEQEKFLLKEFPNEAAKKLAQNELMDKYLGEDSVKIKSISLSEDKRTVFLELADIKPVMQMKIGYNLLDAKGVKVKNEIYQTIHKLGAWEGTPGKAIQISDNSGVESGIAVEFLHLGQSKNDFRVQRLAAFHIPEKTSVTQFLDHGPFAAKFNGFIKSERNMKVTFYPKGKGKATLSLNGVVIFKDADLSIEKGYEVSLVKDLNKLNILYNSPERGDATFRLYWESLEYFPKEPVPAKVLFHEKSDENLQKSLFKREGLHLALEKKCFSCHEAGKDLAIPELGAGKISLSDLGSRIKPEWVRSWLTDPKGMKSHANMPQMLKNLPEAEWSKAAGDIAVFLTEDKKPLNHVEGDKLLGEQLFGELGCATCHSVGEDKKDEKISLNLVGFKFKHGAISEFLQNPTQHNPSSKMANFQLSKTEAVNLESYLRSVGIMLKILAVEGDAAAGGKYFRELNCAACHDFKDEKANFKGDIFGKTGGCLNGGGGGKPFYDLSVKEREFLQEFLLSGKESLKQLEPIEFSQRALKDFNCLNCHGMDDKASVWQSSINLPSATPPNLTHVGEKIENDYLTKIFEGKLTEKMRPWMKARMPIFPVHGKVLAQGLNASYGFSTQDEEPVKQAKQIEEGKKLIQQDGFACIICHAVGEQVALAPFGAPGLNFVVAGKRLRQEYYLRWMLNPQRVEPTTPMTKYSSDHKTTAVKLFDGDAHKQFDAIWDYLQKLKD